MSEPQPSLRLIDRSCPVCSSNQPAPFLQKRELHLVRCRVCSMVYASSVPADLASGQYYNAEMAGYYLSPEKLQSDYADVRFERELRLFRTYCTGGRVLDVGCSSGAFLYQLQKRYPGSYSVLGTDASGPALDYAAQRGIPVVRGNFLEQQFTGPKFNAVTFLAVLEHVADPGHFLEKAAALLAENGVCLVLVPNMRSLAARILGARYRYIYPQHLNYFTRNSLQQLARSWFEVVEARFTHFNPLVIWQDWRDQGADVTNAARGQLLRRTTAYKQSSQFLLRLLKTGYHLAEGALSRLHLADNVALVLRQRRS